MPLARLAQPNVRWLVFLCLSMFVSNFVGSKVLGQGGPGGAQMPSFQEEKFDDKVWEAGGPRIAAKGDGKLVKGVEITGNKTVSPHRILSHMQTREDRLFDDKVLQGDIRELYRTELFESIKPSIADVEDGVIVRLEVRERPIATVVTFHGNQAIDERMLQKHCGIQSGDPVNPSSVEMARRRMLELYSENGFNHADIQVLSGKRVGDREIFFEINEGPLERIWSISFEGNTFASDSLLKARIECRDSRNGIAPYLNNKAIASKIEGDKEQLAAYYRSLGFFQARVGYRAEYDDSGKWMYLTFVIDEGIRFTMRNISVVGQKFHQAEELMAALEMKSGEPFNLGKMTRDIRTLKEIYGAQGFVFVDVEAVPRYQEDGQMDLVYQIEEGDRYRAGEIRVHIEGDSSHTKHNVALNLMGRVRPGSIIDMREVQSAERRMGASGVFETMQTGGEPPRIEIQPPDQDDLPAPKK